MDALGDKISGSKRLLIVSPNMLDDAYFLISYLLVPQRLSCKVSLVFNPPGQIPSSREDMHTNRLSNKTLMYHEDFKYQSDSRSILTLLFVCMEFDTSIEDGSVIS